MEFPNITLHISPEGKSEVRYYTAENEYKILAEGTESLESVLAKLSDKFNFPETTSQELWRRAHEGNDLEYDFSPNDFTGEDMDFGFVYDAVSELHDGGYSDLELDDAVASQLESDAQSDLLASALDGLYRFLIGKTVIFADDMGIQDIVLNDASANPRLRERMSREIADIGGDLIVANMPADFALPIKEEQDVKAD